MKYGFGLFETMARLKGSMARPKLEIATACGRLCMKTDVWHENNAIFLQLSAK